MATRFFTPLNGAGNPITGLAPVFLIWRYSDDTDPVVVDSLAQPTISEIGTTGFYSFTYSPGIDLAFEVDLGSAAVNRYQQDVLSPDDEAITEHRLASIYAATTKQWFEILNGSYTADGKLEAGTLQMYDNAVDAAASTNPILAVAVTATYDGDGLLSGFIGL